MHENKSNEILTASHGMPYWYQIRSKAISNVLIWQQHIIKFIHYMVI